MKMNCLTLLFINLFMAYNESDLSYFIQIGNVKNMYGTEIVCKKPHTLDSIPNLAAFTHPQFFYSNNCKCCKFNFNFFQLEIYNRPTDSIIPYQRANHYIIPPNYEAGYSVIITGKQGDFFRIKFNEDEHPICYKCNDSSYYVKKGTLGTWIYNYNDSIDDYDFVPLYEKPCADSKIINKVKKENSVVIILDIEGSWMLVETIKGKKQKGWLDPRMQCGNPYGIGAGICF